VPPQIQTGVQTRVLSEDKAASASKSMKPGKGKQHGGRLLETYCCILCGGYICSSSRVKIDFYNTPLPVIMVILFTLMESRNL
jgi:hypothetical protein